MNGKLLLVLFFISSVVSAQTNRYFVFFKDKSNSPFSITNPTAFLSQRSIDRRKKQNVSIIEEDLPVNLTYVQQVKATGAKTFFTSKWWNGVLVECNSATVTLIDALPFVIKTELVAPNSKLIGGRIDREENENKVISGANASSNVSEFQLAQLGLDKMQELGFKGEGINIAQFDSGWQGVDINTPFQHLYKEGRVKDVVNFVKNTTNVYVDDSHGTEVLSVMAGYSASSFIGGVYKANYFLYQTEELPTEYRIEEYNWTFAAERADSAGVDVINSSLGYNTFDLSSMDYTYADMTGKKTVVGIAARKAIEKGMLVVSSAGNEGAKSWKYITTPADVEGLLAVGSITSSGSQSSFSSFGPTADGRYKPDVVALGSGTSVITASGSISSASGTSLASPLVACLAAGLVQAYPTIGAREIYNAIVKSGSQALAPDNAKGYGIPNFLSASNSLYQLRQVEDISIYPNPIFSSSGIPLTISFKEPAGSVSITFYDLFGRIVTDIKETLTQSNNPLRFDLSSLSSGLYILEVKSQKSNILMKIVKGN